MTDMEYQACVASLTLLGTIEVRLPGKSLHFTDKEAYSNVFRTIH